MNNEYKLFLWFELFAWGMEFELVEKNVTYNIDKNLSTFLSQFLIFNWTFFSFLQNIMFIPSNMIVQDVIVLNSIIECNNVMASWKCQSKFKNFELRCSRNEIRTLLKAISSQKTEELTTDHYMSLRVISK